MVSLLEKRTKQHQKKATILYERLLEYTFQLWAHCPSTVIFVINSITQYGRYYVKLEDYFDCHLELSMCMFTFISCPCTCPCPYPLWIYIKRFISFHTCTILEWKRSEHLQLTVEMWQQKGEICHQSSYIYNAYHQSVE